MQHEHAPARLVLFGADVGLEDFAGQLHREFFVALFFLGEVAEQAAYADIVSLLCGLDVELLGLQLHRLDLLSDGVERQVLRQPDRAPSQKSLDVLAADRRQMGAEPLLVQFKQPMAVAAFFLGHLLEHLGRVRIAFREVLRESHVDAAVLLLGRDRYSQHFALGQIGEILHGTSAFS